MKCQINKKNNSQCDKEAVLELENIHMCTQHHKTYMKNKTHQYGTCLEQQTNIQNLTIKQYLFQTKIKLSELDF